MNFSIFLLLTIIFNEALIIDFVLQTVQIFMLCTKIIGI